LGRGDLTQDSRYSDLISRLTTPDAALLTKPEIEAFHRYVIAKGTDLTEAEVVALREKKDIKTIDTLLATGMVEVRRGGAPAGVSLKVNDKLGARVVNEDVVQRRINEAHADLDQIVEISKARFNTALLIPTVSRSLAFLGDYDGDAYQLLVRNLQKQHEQVRLAKEEELVVAARYKELISLREDLINIQLVAPDTNRINLLETHIGTVKERLDAAKGITNAKVADLSVLSGRIEEYRDRALTDMRSWTQYYMLLPDFMTGNEDGVSLSTGELLTLTQQSRAPLTGFSDAADFLPKVHADTKQPFC
jgi:hypothetical protein